MSRRLLVPKSSEMISAPRLSASVTSFTRSDSYLAPILRKVLATQTLAFGAMARATPATNVPWPEYGLIRTGWPPYGFSYSPVTPASQECSAAASFSQPLSSTAIETPSPSHALSHRPVDTPGSGCPSGDGSSGSVAGQVPPVHR